MRKLYAGILICFVMFILIAGCVNYQPFDNVPDSTPTVQSTQACLIENAGNGVLVFNCVNAPFVKTLSEYIGEHSNQSVVAIAEVPRANSYNFLNGYIVVMKENK